MKSLISICSSRSYHKLFGLLGLVLPWKISDQPTQPADNLLDANRVELGRTLFFETALSSNKDRSCASCHEPAQMWADGLPTALDLDEQALPRATPSLINVAYAEPIMWDGRSPSLEHQALLPILNKREMGGDIELALERLNASDFYRKAFAEAYETNEITSDFVSRALASFQRTLISDNTEFDRWVALPFFSTSRKVAARYAMTRPTLRTTAFTTLACLQPPARI